MEPLFTKNCYKWQWLKNIDKIGIAGCYHLLQRKEKDMAKNKIFSFFSGSGFLDLGFEKQGLDVVFVNENNQSFLDAYKERSRDTNGTKLSGILIQFCDFHG
jgi:hypothetical protein